LIRHENCAKIRWAQTTPKHKMRTISPQRKQRTQRKAGTYYRGWTRMIADWRRRSAWDKPTDPRSGDRVIGKANSYALIHTDQEHDVRIETLEGREIGKMWTSGPSGNRGIANRRAQRAALVNSLITLARIPAIAQKSSGSRHLPCVVFLKVGRW